MVKQDKLPFIWLPLEGKLAAQQADEVEHLISLIRHFVPPSPKRGRLNRRMLASYLYSLT